MFSGFRRNRTDDLWINSPSLWPSEPRLHVRSEINPKHAVFCGHSWQASSWVDCRKLWPWKLKTLRVVFLHGRSSCSSLLRLKHVKMETPPADIRLFCSALLWVVFQRNPLQSSLNCGNPNFLRPGIFPNKKLFCQYLCNFIDLWAHRIQDLQVGLWQPLPGRSHAHVAVIIWTTCLNLLIFDRSGIRWQARDPGHGIRNAAARVAGGFVSNLSQPQVNKSWQKTPPNLPRPQFW